jgi:sporulation protein YlmC with PRC-barrel domain
MQSDGTQTFTAAPTGLGAPTTRASTGSDRPRVWLASELIGTRVNDTQGEKLGTIDDIVVHPGGHSSYAVLTIGGWLGMGDKLYAVPFSVLRSLESNTVAKVEDLSLVLPLTKERLLEAPGFDRHAWPSSANTDWIDEVDRFYVGPASSSAAERQTSFVPASRTALRATELDGRAVKNQLDETLGDIDEIAIDSNGRVRYAVLSVGGFLGIGETSIAIPWDSLAFSSHAGSDDGDLITLSTTKEHLASAPRYKGDAEHVWEMRDAGWISGVYKHFEGGPR